MDSNEPPPIPPSSGQNVPPPIPPVAAPAVPPPIAGVAASPGAAPAKKSNTAMWVVLIILGFFLLGILGAVGAGWFFYKKFQSTMAEMSQSQGTVIEDEASGDSPSSSSGEAKNPKTKTEPVDAMTQMLVTQAMNQTVQQLLASNPNVERIANKDPNVIKFRNKKTGKTGNLDIRAFLQTQDPNTLMNEELLAVFDDSGNVESSEAAPPEMIVPEPPQSSVEYIQEVPAEQPAPAPEPPPAAETPADSSAQ